MNINNRKIAAIYRILAAFIGIITIIFQFGIFSEEKRFENILYFTTISNLLCIIMFIVLSIKTFADIKKYARTIEKRLDDDTYTIEDILKDNAQFLELAKKYNVNYVLIDDKYEIGIQLF